MQFAIKMDQIIRQMCSFCRFQVFQLAPPEIYEKKLVMMDLDVCVWYYFIFDAERLQMALMKMLKGFVSVWQMHLNATNSPNLALLFGIMYIYSTLMRPICIYMWAK